LNAANATRAQHHSNMPRRPAQGLQPDFRSVVKSPPLQWQPLRAAGALQWIEATHDADAQAQAQPGWRQHYEQLSPGAFEGLVQHVQLPGLRLVREDSSRALHQRGDLGSDAYGLALPLAQSAPAIFNGRRVGRDDLMVGRGDALDLVTPEQFSLIAVVVDAALLHPLWQELYGKRPSAWIEQQLVVPARAAAATAVRRLHLQALQQLCADASPIADETALLQLRDAPLIEWIEALPERVDASELPTLAARKQLVQQACALMLSRADEPLSMLQVCRHVGASRRKLNYCFQDVLGTSPLKYLRALRLNGVRRALRGGAASVQQAAARWGFWRLGEFAADYRRQFGELPSHTLKQPR
jgi:AraC family transcriptional regulator, ethanolamine operon transcriptional activator